MRIFPKNLSTSEQNNFFHYLIWEKAGESSEMYAKTIFRVKKLISFN